MTITARDPSGDKGSSSVDVIVNITDVNEPPAWTKPPQDGISVRYEENGTDAVEQFVAKNPETPNPGPGISYSLVTDVTDIGVLDAADIADRGQFSINPLDGTLSFNSPPNYEKPEDIAEATGTNPAVAGDNKYRVAVQAVAADPDGTGIDITTVYRKITVIVTNVNEAPVFTEEEFTLRIKENADDLHKEPTAERRPLYLLNRGVGIPGTNLPVAPNLDVGTPMAAGDDDSTSTFTIGGPADTFVDRIDGLTYELIRGSGDALEVFYIVPATGQILSQEKLNHEIAPTYTLTVQATDPWNASDTIVLTIEVTNEEEQPIPITVQIAGRSANSSKENVTDDLDDYTATGTGTDATPALSHGGDDKDYFTLTGTGATKTLKFKAAPDYENPRGAEMSDTNTNTYMVTVMGTVKDKDGNDVTGTKNVTITVTDADELGALSGSMTNVSVNEGDTDVPGTYTLTEIEDGPAVTWSLDETGTSDFMLEGTGMSRMLKFSSAPDYETPMGGAANDSNTYMVTVMASAGGEMAMQEVTVMVDNVEEAGTVTLDPMRPSVGTAITATLADADIVETVSWQWASSDAMDGTFTNISGATSATYTPVAADAGMYLRAMATYTDGFDSGNVEMAVSASAVSQVAVNVAPVFASATATRSIAENTAANTNIGNPVAANDPNGDTLTYSLEGTNAASFGIVGSTGQLRTSAALDFETKSTYSVEVRATDLGGLSDTIDVTINVTDVVEVVPAIVQGYDTNGTPGIQISELFVAIDDYFDGQINISELFEVIDAYFG